MKIYTYCLLMAMALAAVLALSTGCTQTGLTERPKPSVFKHPSEVQEGLWIARGSFSALGPDTFLVRSDSLWPAQAEGKTLYAMSAGHTWRFRTEGRDRYNLRASRIGSPLPLINGLIYFIWHETDTLQLRNSTGTLPTGDEFEDALQVAADKWELPPDDVSLFSAGSGESEQLLWAFELPEEAYAPYLNGPLWVRADGTSSLEQSFGLVGGIEGSPFLLRDLTLDGIGDLMVLKRAFNQEHVVYLADENKTWHLIRLGDEDGPNANGASILEP